MSANPREIRRLAFQALYQIDARGGAAATATSSAPPVVHVDKAGVKIAPPPIEDPAAVLAGMLADPKDGEEARYAPSDVKKAFLLASAAYADRARADAFMAEAAPGWPAHRQAAVDRAILRLAHHEMMNGNVPPKVAVNEAVELAKEFSTEKSPAFINGLLDKVLKEVLGEEGAAEHKDGAADEGEAERVKV